MLPLNSLLEGGGQADLKDANLCRALSSHWIVCFASGQTGTDAKSKSTFRANESRGEASDNSSVRFCISRDGIGVYYSHEKSAASQPG